MMELSYYPGCGLEGTSAEYDDSIRAICIALGIDIAELPDWNCCGASSAHVTSDQLAVELAARNLRIADEIGKDVLVPCAACFSRLKIAQKEILAEPEIYGIRLNPDIEILHLGGLLAKPEVLDLIENKVKKRLSGVKAVPYYGCLTMRPPKMLDAVNYEHPTLMDEVLAVLGTEVCKWSYKTDCCGGSLTMSRLDLVHKLTNDLYVAAVEAGANCIVTDCPMCQTNLDTRQGEVNQVFKANYDMPIFFISELLGYALGVGDQRGWWKKHIVDPRPVLIRNGGPWQT